MGLGVGDHGGGRPFCSDRLLCKWRVLGTLVLLVLGGLGTSRFAVGVPGTLPITLLPVLFAEISLAPAPEVLQQDHYEYCGAYALATFLSLWNPAIKSVQIDPAYLGMAYNRLASSGSEGSHMLWYAAAVQYFGALPVGSVPRNGGVSWPLKDWRDRHRTLMPLDELDAILHSRYQIEGEGERTAASYRKNKIGIDFRTFKLYGSHYIETFKKKSSAAADDTIPTQYRYGDYQKTRDVLVPWMKKMGLDTETYSVSALDLYDLVVKQIYLQRPVLVAINSGLTTERFSFYDVLGSGDLKAVGEGEEGSHAITAIGHCDQAERSQNPLCQSFAAEMVKRRIRECLVLQNSWGTEANQKGYVCLSKLAAARVLRAAHLIKGLEASSSKRSPLH